MQTNRLQPAKEEQEELSGNIVVIAIGCKQCPSNQEYQVSNCEEADTASEAVGKVIECARCHSRWLLKRMQVRAMIQAADPVIEEWRVAPMFVPILSTFGTDTITIVDVPVARIEDEKQDE